MQLFLDMDGVLADFDRGHYDAFGVWPDKATDNVDWDRIRRTKDFYANLPPMWDLGILLDGVRRLGLTPIVLTGVPWGVPEAYANKKAWVDRHLPGVQMIGCKSRDKCLHMRAPGDVLVDDWEKYRDLWIEAGGRWVTHINAATTVLELNRLFGHG